MLESLMDSHLWLDKAHVITLDDKGGGRAAGVTTPDGPTNHYLLNMRSRYRIEHLPRLRPVTAGLVRGSEPPKFWAMEALASVALIIHPSILSNSWTGSTEYSPVSTRRKIPR